MRKNRARVRKVNPDPKFGSVVMTKFMNVLMLDGKKTTAEKNFYAAMDMIETKLKKNPLEVFEQCIEDVKPSLEVRSRRVGGATYQVPMEVRPARQQTLAIRWIVDAARKRNEKTIAERVFKEFADIMNGSGNSVKKKSDTHKMADANKAFAHFRW